MVRALIGAFWGAFLGGLIGCLPCVLILCDFAFFKLNEYDEMMGVILYASLVTCVPFAALVDESGILRARGPVNSREQIESVLGDQYYEMAG